jgi:hypothetical protein
VILFGLDFGKDFPGKLRFYPRGEVARIRLGDDGEEDSDDGEDGKAEQGTPKKKKNKPPKLYTLKQLQAKERNEKKEEKKEAEKAEKLPLCELVVTRKEGASFYGFTPVLLGQMLGGSCPVPKLGSMVNALDHAALGLGPGPLSPLEVVQSKALKPSLDFDHGLRSCWCVGYLLALVSYRDDDQQINTFETVVAFAFNIRLEGGKYVLHTLEDGKSQIHVEEQCGSMLDALLDKLYSMDGKPVLFDAKTVKFDARRLGVDARVRFSGSQTSVCGACSKLWKKLEKKWSQKGKLRHFEYSVMKET